MCCKTYYDAKLSINRANSKFLLKKLQKDPARIISFLLHPCRYDLLKLSFRLVV